jgi:LPXTG-motif cell wall-anchored protein
LITYGRKIAAGAAVALLGLVLLAVGFTGAPAAATTPTPAASAGPSFDTCANLKGWYVNPDEVSRRPIATVTGLKFVGNDLIHHATTGTVADLVPGSFVAAPAPDQPSFFSVEVGTKVGDVVTGYATLRWNTVTSKWNMVTGGQFYENASAVALVAMPPVAKSSTLMSFGVGYTNSPPGTVDTVVSSATFAGKTYPLTCAPAPSQSASASKSASAVPSSSASADGEALPVTGSKPLIAAGVGAVLLLGGVLAVALSRRRRIEYRS